MESDDYRDVWPIVCHFCPSPTPATLRVTERETGDSLEVCEAHKWTAFS